MEVDRTGLSPKEVQIIDAWEELFSTVGWRMVQERFAPRMEATVSDMENSLDLLCLGRAQGRREVLRELLGLDENVEIELRWAYQAEPTEAE